MQASTYVVKGNLGFEVQNRKGVLSGLGGFRNSSPVLFSNLRFVNSNNEKAGSSKLSCGSAPVGIGCAKMGIDRVFKSSAKYRSVKAQASSGLSS